MTLLFQFRALLFSAGVFYCCARAEERAFGGAPAPLSLTFRSSERPVYELRWGVIPAGFVELTILPPSDLPGVPHHSHLSIQPNGFDDVLYKVRDNIETFTDTLRELSGGFSPLMG